MIKYTFPAHARLPCILLGLLLLTCGCSKPVQLDTTYGRTFGTPGQKSVNGTSVLVEMFEQAGHNVTTVSRFSPRLEKADTIVWFPDDFQPPSTKHREYLEEWLGQQAGRTVIYVGRDYDATADYWNQAMPYAKPEQAAEYHRKRAAAMSDWTAERAQIPAGSFERWFKTDSSLPPRPVTTLEGPWSKGINPTKTNIQLGVRYNIPTLQDRPTTDYRELPEFEVLLASKQRLVAEASETDAESPESQGPAEPLALRLTSNSWYDSQIIVVANGSFLLNLPLVNKEHRKLAGHLIEECTPGGNVVFVESGVGGPPIRKREENPPPRTGFDMLAVWPLNVILLHSIVWMLLVCICLYPIFGRPRKVYGVFGRAATRLTSPLAHLLLAPPPAGIDQEDAPHSTGDFGRHLTALGELISLTGKREYAEEKLRYYHEHVKRDSGVTHVPGKAAAKPKPTQPTTTNLP